MNNNRYDSIIDINANDSHGMILRQIQPGSSVLEFGPATGCMTQYMRETLHCNVYIVEIDREAFEQASQWTTDGVCGNIEDYAWVDRFCDVKFDYILFADVLEHLSDPQQVLVRAKTLLKEDGKVIASVPNMAYAGVLAELCQNRFQYRETGLLDRTHIHFFAYYSFVELFKNAQYCVTVYDATRLLLSDSEFKTIAPQLTPRQLDFLRDKSFGDVYQFVFTAVKEEYCEKSEAVRIEDRLHITEEISKAYVNGGQPSKVYFDCGKGLSEENSVQIELDGQEHAERRICLPEGCRAIRFDPAHGMAALVWDFQARTENSFLKVKRHNGLQLGDVFVFSTLMPEMFLEDIPVGSRWLSISAEIVLVNQGTLLMLIHEIEKTQAALRNMEEEAESQRKQIEEIQAAFNAEQELFICQQHTFEQLRNEKEKQSDAYQELQDRFEAQSRELSFSKQACAQQEDAYSQLVAQYKQVKDEADHREKAYRRLRSEYEKQHGEYAQLMAQYSQTGSMYHELALQYSTMAGSASWRITAPLRKTLDVLKKNDHVNRAFNAAKYLKRYGPRATVRRIKECLKKEEPIHIQVYDRYDSLEQMASHSALTQNEDRTEKVYLPELLESYKHREEKKILLVTHELALTGAPMAVRYFAVSLKDLGYCPVVVSPKDGKLAEILSGENVPVLVLPTLFGSNDIQRLTALFDLIVLNTIVSAQVMPALDGMDIPILWWIHEAHASYIPKYLEHMPRILPSNVMVCAVGAHAKRILHEYRPDYATDELLYYVPDFSAEAFEEVKCLPAEVANKKLFLMVGTLEQRKGHPVLAKAIARLPEAVRRECFFLIVGKQCYGPSNECVADICCRFPKNAAYIEELLPEELKQVYARMDCLICASLDDPMPIVVTEALILSKLVICSENTGSARLLADEKGGIVYANNDPGELARCIERVVKHPEDYKQMEKAGRGIYEEFFSAEAFAGNVKKRIEGMLYGGQENVCDPLSMAAFVRAYEEEEAPGDRFALKEVVTAYDQEPDKKRVLLISHELSLTGAPIVLLNLAQSLRDAGANVIVLSPFDGDMFDECVANEIPIMVYQKLYADQFLTLNADKFDLIIPSTVVTYRAINMLANCSTPVVWWIHDSAASYTIGGFGHCMPQTLPSNVTVFCGGEYARDQLLKNYPGYEAQILYYASPDMAEESLNYPTYDMRRDPNRKAFTVIGLQDARKGHDIFAEAIKMLSDEERSGMQFYFIGKHLDAPIQAAVDEVCELFPECVTYIPQVNRQELFSVYRQSDCIVCSSKDDPLPVFVTEAMMMSKTIICSEHTGSAPIIEREQCGLIYHNDDPAELAQRMREAMADTAQLQKMQIRARAAYEKIFSQDAFDFHVGELLGAQSYSWTPNVYHGIVSVIIPTYNGGTQLAEMFKRLRSQKDVRCVEIIAVDSGSTDGTTDICAQYGVRLIQISQKQFSHSYARNLGYTVSRGEILLFMTQDALPADEHWIGKMIQPIIDREAEAVSCRELCPQGTDLYYVIAAWNHAGYLGIRDGDRLNTLVEKDTHDSLRPRASLNDVSCAVSREVFGQFLYRFDYAEDLDLGLRLLMSGHSIKLLGSVRVIHGHNREAGYYLKRGYVESLSIGKIYDGWKVFPESASTVSRKILHSARVLNRAILKTRECCRGTYEWDAFRLMLKDNLLRATAVCRMDVSIPAGFANADSVVCQVLSILSQYEGLPFEEENEILDRCTHYLDHIVWPYLDSEGIKMLDIDMQERIYSCIQKQHSLIAGNLLARIQSDTELYAQIQNLTQGV